MKTYEQFVNEIKILPKKIKIFACIALKKNPIVKIMK